MRRSLVYDFAVNMEDNCLTDGGLRILSSEILLSLMFFWRSTPGLGVKTFHASQECGSSKLSQGKILSQEYSTLDCPRPPPPVGIRMAHTSAVLEKLHKDALGILEMIF